MVGDRLLEGLINGQKWPVATVRQRFSGLIVWQLVFRPAFRILYIHTYKRIRAMAVFADLLQRQVVCRGRAPTADAPSAQTGYAALDAELPGGGWPVGGLAELLCRTEGIGELQLVLPALAALTQAGHRIAWLAPPYLPYAPALQAAGVRLEGLTVVR